ncbi:MAG: rod shape-determining protein MreD [Deltaproteobacteria bacterium]|nr:rod shape-determining protein MreD [Deltaproteobacteria bacterium]
MKSFLVFFFFGLVVLVSQTAIFAGLPYAEYLDLVNVFVIYLGFSQTFLPGLLISVLMGFLVDMLSGEFLGLYMTIYYIVFIITYQIWIHFNIRMSFYQAFIVFLSSIVKGFVLLGGLVVFTSDSIQVLPFLRFSFFQAVTGALVSPVIFYIFTKFDQYQRRLLQRTPHAEQSG